MYDEIELARFPESVPQYILDRGISLETCRKWGLRYDKDWTDEDGNKRPRVMFPVRRRDGGLTGIVGRAIDDTKERKYFNYWNFHKARYLFGENMVGARERVVVVEGLIDTLKWWEYGIPTVGLMGGHASDRQTGFLLEYERVYLALDQDTAGIGGTERLASKIKKLVSTYLVKFPSGKTDPKQLTRDEAHASILEAHRIL